MLNGNQDKRKPSNLQSVEEPFGQLAIVKHDEAVVDHEDLVCRDDGVKNANVSVSPLLISRMSPAIVGMFLSSLRRMSAYLTNSL